MADIKISQMTAVSAVAGTNEFEVNESGTSKKATATQVAAFVWEQKWAAHAWANYTSVTTTALTDSVGISGFTDVGAGVTTLTFTTALSNADYAVLVGGITGGVRIFPSTRGTGSCTITTNNSAGTATDYAAVNVAFIG